MAEQGRAVGSWRPALLWHHWGGADGPRGLAWDAGLWAAWQELGRECQGWRCPRDRDIQHLKGAARHNPTKPTLFVEWQLEARETILEHVRKRKVSVFQVFMKSSQSE